MIKAEILEKIGKLERKSKIDRIINVVFGLSLVVLALLHPFDGGLSIINELNTKFLFSAVGGVVLGQGIWNWNGDEKLQLLRQVVTDINEEEKNSTP